MGITLGRIDWTVQPVLRTTCIRSTYPRLKDGVYRKVSLYFSNVNWSTAVISKFRKCTKSTNQTTINIIQPLARELITCWNSHWSVQQVHNTQQPMVVKSCLNFLNALVYLINSCHRIKSLPACERLAPFLQCNGFRDGPIYHISTTNVRVLYLQLLIVNTVVMKTAYSTHTSVTK